MHRQFTATVETLERSGDLPAVTFTESPGHYPVSPAPAELLEILRESLHSGRAVRVTCESGSLAIVDVVLD